MRVVVTEIEQLDAGESPEVVGMVSGADEGDAWSQELTRLSQTRASGRNDGQIRASL